jgi:hypothetical protein
LQGLFPGIPKPDPYPHEPRRSCGGSRACGVLVKECAMEANGLLDGSGEMVPGHGVLDGTDLEIAHNLQGDDLVLRVNKGGVLPVKRRAILTPRIASPDDVTLAGQIRRHLIAVD